MDFDPIERGFNLNHLRGDALRAGFHRSDIVLQRGQNGFQFAQQSACLGVVFGIRVAAVVRRNGMSADWSSIRIKAGGSA